MKALLQKLPLDNDRSFVCRTYRTPIFETPWHQHVEFELVMMTEGYGQAIIGDYYGEYQQGDVFFLGSNLPHWFRKADPDRTGSALVVHFVPEFMGKPFLNLPEMQAARQVMERSAQGLKLTGETQRLVADWLRQMETEPALTPLWLLLRCLDQMARSAEIDILCSSASRHDPLADVGEISRIFDYTMTHFQEPIRLNEMADLVNMSRATFCRRFRQSTKKSFVDFLKEVRIGHACSLLASTNLSVTAVGEQSGYNNMANFSRQFRELKQMTPLQYRIRVTRR